MKEFAVLRLVFNSISVEYKTPTLDDSLIELFTNFGFPFGSGWGKLQGARSFKLFPINNEQVCVTFSVVRTIEVKRKRQSVFYSLATIQEGREIDYEIRRSPYWEENIFGELLPLIRSKKLGRIFKDALYRDVYYPPRISFSHWIRAKMGMKIVLHLTQDDYLHPTIVEDYVRRIFLATYGKRRLSRLFGLSPTIPSFTTLSLTESEFTQIVVVPQSNKIARNINFRTKYEVAG